MMFGAKLKAMALKTGLNAKLPEGVRAEDVRLDAAARVLHLRLRVDRVGRSFDLRMHDYALVDGRLGWSRIEIDRGELALPPEAAQALGALL